jgi:hypothetical protein
VKVAKSYNNASYYARSKKEGKKTPSMKKKEAEREAKRSNRVNIAQCSRLDDSRRNWRKRVWRKKMQRKRTMKRTMSTWLLLRNHSQRRRAVKKSKRHIRRVVSLFFKF